MVRRLFILFVFVSFTVLVDSPAYAQDKSSWGVQVSSGQQWQILPQIKNIFQSDVDLNGREFRVGLIVRGQILSGDWGVSFTRNTIDAVSVIRSRDDVCGGYPDSEYRCYPIGTTYQLNNVSFDGLEVHKYYVPPFGTIAKRVQIGVNIVGGAVWVKGSAEKRVNTVREVNELPARLYYVPEETVSTITAEDAFRDQDVPTTLLTARLEVAVAVIVVRGLKIKFSRGIIGVPGQSRFNISATYLF